MDWKEFLNKYFKSAMFDPNQGDCCFWPERQRRGREAVEGGVQGDDDEGQGGWQGEEQGQQGEGEGEKDLRREDLGKLVLRRVRNLMLMPLGFWHDSKQAQVLPFCSLFTKFTFKHSCTLKTKELYQSVWLHHISIIYSRLFTINCIYLSEVRHSVS